MCCISSVCVCGRPQETHDPLEVLPGNALMYIFFVFILITFQGFGPNGWVSHMEKAMTFMKYGSTISNIAYRMCLYFCCGLIP